MKKYKNYTITPEQLVKKWLQKEITQKELDELFIIPDLSAYENDGIKVIGKVKFMRFTEFDLNEIDNEVQAYKVKLLRLRIKRFLITKNTIRFVPLMIMRPIKNTHSFKSKKIILLA